MTHYETTNFRDNRTFVSGKQYRRFHEDTRENAKRHRVDLTSERKSSSPREIRFL